MKQVIIKIILAVVCCSCQTQPVETVDVVEHPPIQQLSVIDTFYLGNKLVHVERIDSLDFGSENPQSIDSSGMYALNDGLVRKNGDSLLFLCDRATVSLVNDTSDSDGWSRYFYMGYMSDIGQYLVYGTFYEWFSYLLIDKKTADTTYISGVPQISPNKSTFVSGNVDLLAEFDFNGIEIYKNTNKPTLIAQRSLSKWGPHEIKWLDNTTLLVKGLELDSTGIGERWIYRKLKIE